VAFPRVTDPMTIRSHDHPTRRPQRHGIGRRLVKALEERAHAAGFTALSVASRLTAVPFYESAGYRRTGASCTNRAGVDFRWSSGS
jgi:GNAT superfamily N-acetyltransferase